jgi:hypothetical protein
MDFINAEVIGVYICLALVLALLFALKRVSDTNQVRESVSKSSDHDLKRDKTLLLSENPLRKSDEQEKTPTKSKRTRRTSSGTKKETAPIEEEIPHSPYVL